MARPAITPPPVELATEDEPPPQTWYEFSRESLKGWSTSLTLHGLILVALALWVIVPRSNPPRAFSTRLAGSENGVEEGLSLTGGLNTPLDMSVTPEPTPEPALTGLKPIDMTSLDIKPQENLGAAKAEPRPAGGTTTPAPATATASGSPGSAREGRASAASP